MIGIVVENHNGRWLGRAVRLSQYRTPLAEAQYVEHEGQPIAIWASDPEEAARLVYNKLLDAGVLTRSLKTPMEGVGNEPYEIGILNTKGIPLVSEG